MTGHEMLTKLDAGLLADAFPNTVRGDAAMAADAIVVHLYGRQWTERFAVCVEREQVLIPARLHFASIRSDDHLSQDAWLMASCLRTRSNDGFERQRAVRDLLSNVRPWSAPFIIALMGEYVREILDDIEAAMSPRLADALSDFIAANPGYWRLTKQRIASYWDVYYRRDFRRSEYVGFKLVDLLQRRGSASVSQ